MDLTQSPGRQEVLYRFAARKALDDLRKGAPLDETLVEHLGTQPVLTYCREAVAKEDKDLLKDIARNAKEPLPLRRFCLKLLRPFEKDKDVRDCFYELWKTAFDYEIKMEVLWGLLGHADLSAEIYADIVSQFYKANWDQWLPLIVEKLDGEAGEKSQVKELMKIYFNL
ncbi:MAG TPA: hypothetical protein PK090_01995 [Smithellaceae bacterium]|nr:hypothetical protein [Smithellaceae bacterium]